MSTLRPSRALTHPLWWAALALLVVNDHLFKGAEVLPMALTGKLSDFAGLMVAPVVLAALLRVRTGRGLALAHVATGLGFALINVSPAVAGAFEGLMAHTPWPWAIYVDPTDLLALPMLALSWVVFTPWTRRPVATGALLARAGVVAGAWASVATSPPPEPVQPPPTQMWFGSEDARFMIRNGGTTAQIVRVRALRADVLLDCAALMTDPAALLGRELFEAATVWQLDAGRAMPLDTEGATRGACPAYLVDGPELAARVVFFQAALYPVTTLNTGAAEVQADRALTFDELGWAGHPVLFEQRRAAPEPPTGDCRLPEDGAGVAWTAPPGRTMILRERLASPDGCHRLTVDDDGWIEPWYLCLGGAPLPFDVGDEITATSVTPDRLVVEGPRHTLTLVAGNFDEGELRLADLRAEAGCTGSTDLCGGFRLPLEIQITEADSGLSGWLGSGDTAELEINTVHVVRVEQPIIGEPTCGTEQIAPYFELVSVRRR